MIMHVCNIHTGWMFFVQIDELMKQLKAMHDNAALSLQEAKLTSDSQITSLR